MHVFPELYEMNFMGLIKSVLEDTRAKREMIFLVEQTLKFYIHSDFCDILTSNQHPVQGCACHVFHQLLMTSCVCSEFAAKIVAKIVHHAGNEAEKSGNLL